MSDLNVPQLQLPRFDIRLQRDADGSVRLWDILREKWIVVTPEEWVRQHFVNYLINYCGFPRSMMANEVGLVLNGTKRRCDTVIYTRSMQPLCIVEYKRPSVKITREVFDQIARYNSVIYAPFLIVSNGLTHYCCQFTGSTYRFLPSIPSYDDMQKPKM